MQARKFFTAIFMALTIIVLMFASAPAAYGQEAAYRRQGNESPTAPPTEIVETEPPTEAPTETETPQAPATETILPSATPQATKTSTPTSTAITKPQKSLHDDSNLYVNDEVLIHFNSPRAKERWDADVKSLGGKEIGEIAELGVIQLQIPAGTVESFIEEMRNKSGVVYVEPNYYLYALDTIPNDTDYPSQYGLNAIRAPQGWDISTGSTGVIIAIVDSGVDLNHPDLAAKIVGGVLGKGKDFVNNDDIAQDDCGHGTHVAGIAAASSNNGIGVSGVSWGARIMPVKVLDAGCGGNFADAIAGITWAADNGAQIMNLSFGTYLISSAFKDSIDYAYGKGVTIIAASGNDNIGTVMYPAAYSDVIAVGATNDTNTRWSSPPFGSNYGPELDVMAPGVNIYSTYPSNTYAYKTGTSMSAPYVAGAAAILRGYFSSPSAIQAQLQNTALDLGAAGYDNFYGYGLIQLDKALLPFAPPTNTPTFIPSFTPTFTLTPHQTNGNYSPYYQFFPVLAYSPTLIPTINQPVITQTETTFPTLTETSTTRSEETNTSTNTPTENLDLQAQSGTSYWLPCIGILCLLAGLLILFWMRRQPKHYF